MTGAAAAATHAELTQLIARGDRRRAASLLVRDHAAAVFGLCRAMVRDPRLAEDLSQDAFARAFGAIDGFRGEASPRTWLLKIARNRCLDHLSRARRAPWAGDDVLEPDDHAADEPPPYDLLARREDAERAMSVLGEIERALVVLHFGHGVGYPELADSFGLRAGAVRMRISRALARMRAALEDTDFAAESPTSPEAVGAGAALGAALGAAALDDDRVIGGLDDTDLGTPGDLGLDEALDTTMRAAPEEQRAPTWDQAPATFGSLREAVPPALRGRLDSLAAAV